MKLRESLFFSSKDSAYKESSEGDKAYRIYVKEQQEEYTSFFMLPSSPPGPYYRPVYHVSVHTIKDITIAEPHLTRGFHDIDKGEEFLKDWRIDIEQGWIPEEDNDKYTKDVTE